MDTVFSSDDVHQRDRFSYWHEVACQTIVQHHSAPESATGFHARLSAHEIDDIGLLLVESAPMTVERDRKLIAQADHDDLLLCMQRQGVVEFRGLEDLLLGQGHVTLLDPSDSYTGRFVGDCEMLVARIPRRDLETRIGSASKLVLKPLDLNNPDLQLAIKILRTTMESPPASPRGGPVIRDAVMDLLAVSMSAQLQSSAKLSSTRARALLNIRQVVRRNLSNPDFSVADAASLAGMSVRYANVLLHAEGTSLGRLILSARLERCASCLADPGQAHRSIQEIAYSWGFSDQSNFGRRFKEAFGMSPKDFRRSTTSNVLSRAPDKISRS